MNLSGGSIKTSLAAYDTTTVNITGGSFDSLFIQNNSIANIHGGSFTFPTDLLVADRGILNVYGSGLGATLIDPDYNGVGFSEYLLSGVLDNGSNLNNASLLVQNGGGSIVTFNGQTVITGVPEPGSAALLVGMMAVGAGVLRKRRK